MNKVILIWRLGSEPEVKQTPGGAKVGGVPVPESPPEFEAGKSNFDDDIPF